MNISLSAFVPENLVSYSPGERGTYYSSRAHRNTFVVLARGFYRACPGSRVENKRQLYRAVHALVLQSIVVVNTVVKTDAS